ncbi:uncharacterized protein LOC119547141 [Drosophila subpulchrella]|uniref:uncharacterized protein LOC119547141 n=1 Tax=Drosophila subpulchrella TaxID=1486046 RepID=UPI0018A14E3F|nr:uncharacterized protein LOC119547141 [Drosophila subpulchrella]
MFLQVFSNDLNKFRHTVFINVKPNFSVANLKFELFKSVKIPVQRQVIMFLGAILADDFPVARAFNRNRADLQAFDGQKLVCVLRFRDKMEFKETLSTSSSMMSRKNERPRDAQSEFVGLADGCSSASSSASSTSSSEESTPTPSSASVSSTVNEQSCGDPCQVNCCDEGGEGRPPYARVMPEDRRYGVVITNECNPCDCNFDCVLQHLVESFHSAVDVATLSFSQCTPAVSFECLLLMVCRDSDTSDWLQRAMRPMSPTYLCTTFIKHFELVRCSFVVPMVVERELCRIFHIMEKQNCGLDLSKWCVVRKTALDPCSEDYARRVIFDGYPNYELVVYMDNCSKDYILHHCGKILFIMWHLPVDFSTDLPCQ